jgi:GrpB-like predicted nucleotidyltransferase (UPF0157 family)
MSDFRIVEYQEAWPLQFLQVAEHLRATVHGPGTVVEHIGSTAVPGLCSKPVLDILLGVETLRQVEAAIPALVEAGFAYRPEYESQIPDRRYFIKPAASLPRLHLHAVTVGSKLWDQHLHFRDRLREDAVLRKDYAALKKHLYIIHAGDKVAYTEAKAPFIQRVLASRPANATSAAQGPA